MVGGDTIKIDIARTKEVSCMQLFLFLFLDIKFSSKFDNEIGELLYILRSRCFKVVGQNK